MTANLGVAAGLCGAIETQANARALVILLGDPDATKATRIMQAMMTMSKINIAQLQQAYAAK